MLSNVLIIDDQIKKYNELQRYFSDHRKEVKTEWARNFRSAQNTLQRRSFDLIVLDMSFPVHGATSEDTAFEGLAGLHVLQFLWRSRIRTKVVICTSHMEYSDPTFGRIIGLDSLKDHVARTFGDTVIDCVLIGADESIWHAALGKALTDAQF